MRLPTRFIRFAVLIIFVLTGLQAKLARAQSPSDTRLLTLRSLLLQQLGEMTQSDVQLYRSHLARHTTYRSGNGGGRTLGLTLGYGADFQQQIRQNGLAEVRQADGTASTVAIDGHTVQVFEDAPRVAALAFPGKLALTAELRGEEAPSWDPDTAREHLLEILRTLDLQRLAAFRMMTSDALRSFLPEATDRMTRGEVEAAPRKIALRTTYRAHDGCGHPIELALDYNAERPKTNEGTSTIQVDGYDVRVTKQPLNLRMTVFPGKLTIIGQTDLDTWDAAAAQEQVLNVFEALDMKRLEAFVDSADADAARLSSTRVDSILADPGAAGFKKMNGSINADLLGALRPGEPASYLAWLHAPISAQLVDSTSHGARAYTHRTRPGDYTTEASTGKPCMGGSPTCRPALDSLHVEHSSIACCPPAIAEYRFLAVTRGDSVFAVTSPEEAARFLAPIDTAAEVVLLLTFEESTPDYVRAGPGDRFTVLDDVRVFDCPVTRQTHLIRVFPNGRIKTIARGPLRESGGCI